MTADHALLPTSLLSSPKDARAQVAAIAGAGAAACALAGCWIRFEDGIELRVILGATSALFAAATLVVALTARSAWGAIGRALALSTALGVASTIGPSLYLAGSHSNRILGYLMFGMIFGPFIGFAYGLVLAALAGLTWRNVNSWTHDGTDRATRTAAVWAFFPIAVALGTSLFEADFPQQPAAQLGIIGAVLALGVALVLCASAEVRILRRSRWIMGVLWSEDPRWSIRELGPHDDLASLPRLRDGRHVLEHHCEESGYRVAATGRAVAIL